MISLPKEVVQAVLNYLAQRPFAEVAQLIQAIQTQHKVVEEPTVEE